MAWCRSSGCCWLRPTPRLAPWPIAVRSRCGAIWIKSRSPISPPSTFSDRQQTRTPSTARAQAIFRDLTLPLARAQRLKFYRYDPTQFLRTVHVSKPSHSCVLSNPFHRASSHKCIRGGNRWPANCSGTGTMLGVEGPANDHQDRTPSALTENLKKGLILPNS